MKKFIASSLVVFQLHTQVVCAGIPLWMGPPPGVSELKKNLLKISQKASRQSLALFNAFPYKNFFDLRGNSDRPEESQTTPEGVVQREERQADILRQMEELQIFREETFANRPQLPNSTPNILDGMTTYKLNVNIAKELRKVQEERKQTTQEIETEIESMRKAVKGAGGSMKIQQDGARFFFLHGLLVSIRGQRYLDGNGQVTRVDTRRIKYDKDRRLQRGSTRISTDSRGNVTVTVRSDIEYSKDSHQHGKQIVTGYRDTIMDPLGNVSTVERKNINYLELPEMRQKINGEDKRGQYVTSYDEIETDQFGNKTVRRFENAAYVRLGDNWYMTQFDQTETDADQNTTITQRRGAGYIHNRNFKHMKSIHSTRQEFLLGNYTQTIIDPRGLERTEIWNNAAYDSRDNLFRFDQVNLNSNKSLATQILFRAGAYDRFGQQTGFERLETYATAITCAPTGSTPFTTTWGI